MITASLKRPVGFKGVPLFADDKYEKSDYCTVKKNPSDELTFEIKITNFTKCGVIKRNVSFYLSSIYVYKNTIFLNRILLQATQ